MKDGLPKEDIKDSNSRNSPNSFNNAETIIGPLKYKREKEESEDLLSENSSSSSFNSAEAIIEPLKRKRKIDLPATTLPEKKLRKATNLIRTKCSSYTLSLTSFLPKPKTAPQPPPEKEEISETEVEIPFSRNQP